MLNKNNLFDVDHNEIERLLKEANSAWLRQYETLIDDTKRIPKKITTIKDFELAQALVKNLNAARQRTKSERLSDQKPFNQAVKVIKSFYDEVEGSIKMSLQTLLQRLAAATQNTQNASGIETEVDATGGTSLPTKLGPGLKLLWSVKSVDRSTVDLELLRDHFTDNALFSACQKLLDEQGPIQTPGIEYERVAKAK